MEPLPLLSSTPSWLRSRHSELGGEKQRNREIESSPSIVSLSARSTSKLQPLHPQPLLSTNRLAQRDARLAELDDTLRRAQQENVRVRAEATAAVDAARAAAAQAAATATATTAATEGNGGGGPAGAPLSDAALAKAFDPIDGEQEEEEGATTKRAAALSAKLASKTLEALTLRRSLAAARAAAGPSVAQARQLLLDLAVAREFERLRREVEAHAGAAARLREQLRAVPGAAGAEALVARFHELQRENRGLAAAASEGRAAQAEGRAALAVAAAERARRGEAEALARAVAAEKSSGGGGERERERGEREKRERSRGGSRERAPKRERESVPPQQPADQQHRQQQQQQRAPSTRSRREPSEGADAGSNKRRR